MNRYQKQLASVLALLMVLCMLFTACAESLPNGIETGTHEHSDTESESKTDTETESGSETESETVEGECPHAETTVVGKKDPTCDEEGYTGDAVCTVCGDVVIPGTAVPTVDHAWDAGVETKAPSCYEEGVKTFTCAGCLTTRTETHTHTCGTCTMSSNEKHEPKGEGTVHGATCTEDGYTEYVCSLCEGVYRVYSETDKAKGHDWSKWKITEDATCAKVGEKEHTCQRGDCGVSETVEIPVNPDNHEYERLNPEDLPTCVASVEARYACVHCQASKVEIIEATGKHDYVVQEDKGDGWTRQICSVCEDEIAKYDASKKTQADVKADDIPKDTAFEVNTLNANIQFPQDVVSQLTGTEGANVSISADVVGDDSKKGVLEGATNLTQEQKERLETVDIFDFGVLVGDQPLKQFESKVTVTMPYELKKDEDPEGVLIWYVANDGTIEEVPAKYDPETKTVTFEVEHFSFYAVAYRETQEMKCKRGDHKYEPTLTVVPPTCANYGYTVHQCVACLKTTVDDIVERKPHNYGAVRPAEPTCEMGDWSTRTCADCGDVIVVEYVRAKGHTPNGVATCTKDSVCTTCNQLLQEAFGHSFGEWVVVVEPTEISTGLRRRSCPACGEVEEVRIAATGLVTELTFDSYEDFIKTLFLKPLGFGNGTIHLAVAQDGYGYDFDITLEESGNSYVILIEGTETYKGESTDITVLYRNGVVIYENYEGNQLLTDFESLLLLPFDVYLDYMEQSFDMVNPQVEQILRQGNQLLKEYQAIFGEKLDALLQASGSELSVSDLQEALDSLETVYTYLALKMGYNTNLEMKDGVEIPTKEDFLNIAEAFLVTSTDANGNVTYTLEQCDGLVILSDLLTSVEKELAKTLGNTVYELIAEDLVKTYPDLTDWAACEAKLRASFTGTMTVKAAIDQVITVLENNHICTLAELYEIIDACVEKSTGEKFDCEEIVKKYYDLTLDQLIVELTGEQDETFARAMDGFFEMMSKQTLGGIVLPIGPEPMPLYQLTANLKQSLTMLTTLKLDLSFTLDANGKLQMLSVGDVVGVTPPSQDGSEVEEMEVQRFELHINVGAGVLEIPESFKPFPSNRIETSYDKDGNLTVGKLPAGYDYEFSIYGSDRFLISDLLTLDEAMTSKLGFEVYVMNRRLWHDTQLIQSLIEIDGKLYEYESYSIDSYTEYCNPVKWSELKSKALEAIPTAGTTPDGFYHNYNEETGKYEQTPVYTHPLGAVYQDNGGNWRLALDYYVDTYHDYIDDVETRTKSYNIYQSAPLEQAIELMELSSIYGDKGETEIMEINGVEREVFRVYLDFSGEEFDFNGSYRGYLDQDELYILQTVKYPYESGYILGDEVTSLKEHETYDEWETTAWIWVAGARFEPVRCKMVSTRNYVPTYYVRIDAENYVVMDTYGKDTEIVVENLPTMLLPNGRTLFVLGKEDDAFVFGFVRIAQDVYVKTVAYLDEAGEIERMMYYRHATHRYADFNDVFDLSQYLTANADGSYTISAELINQLRAICVDEGDNFSFNILASKMVGEKEILVRYRVGTYVIPESINFGNSASPETEYFDWDYYFYYYNPEGSSYEIVFNEDGSLTLNFGAYTVENLYYSVEDYPIKDFVTYDPERSQEYKLDIYHTKTEARSWRSYLYKDGKYYHYDYYTAYDLEIADSVNAIFANEWHLSNLSYRYMTVPSEEYPEPMRVYEGRVRFGESDEWEYSAIEMTFFFALMDGKLYVLQQAEELGMSALKYEAMIPASEYFALLKGEFELPTFDYDGDGNPDVLDEEWYNKYYDSRTVCYNGALIRIYHVPVEIYETDANGNKLADENGEVYPYATAYMWAMRENGEFRFFSQMNHIGNYLVVGSEVEDLDDYKLDDTRESEYVNGTFTIAELVHEYYSYSYYVNLLGKVYNFYDYERNCRDENVLYDRFGEYAWYYAVVDKNDKVSLYQNISFEYREDLYRDVIITSEPIDKPIAAFDYYYNWNYMGQNAAGEEVYEVSGNFLNPEEIEISDLGNGFALYQKNGETLLKTPADTYLYAYTGTDQDGNPAIFLEDMREATLWGEQVSELGVFDKYIQLSEDRTSVTISKELLDVVRDYSYSFNLQIYKPNGYLWFNYYDIETMFAQKDADNGNEGETDKEETPDEKPESDLDKVEPPLQTPEINDGKNEDGTVEDGTVEDGKAEGGYVSQLPEGSYTGSSVSGTVTGSDGNRYFITQVPEGTVGTVTGSYTDAYVTQEPNNTTSFVVSEGAIVVSTQKDDAA